MQKNLFFSCFGVFDQNIFSIQSKWTENYEKRPNLFILIKLGHINAKNSEFPRHMILNRECCVFRKDQVFVNNVCEQYLGLADKHWVIFFIHSGKTLSLFEQYAFMLNKSIRNINDSFCLILQTHRWIGFIEAILFVKRKKKTLKKSLHCDYHLKKWVENVGRIFRHCLNKSRLKEFWCAKIAWISMFQGRFNSL